MRQQISNTPSLFFVSSILLVAVSMRQSSLHAVLVRDVMPMAWRCRNLLLVCDRHRFSNLDFLFNSPQFCDFLINFDWDLLLDSNFDRDRDLDLSKDFDLHGRVNHNGGLDLLGHFDLDFLHFDDGLEIFLLDLNNVGHVHGLFYDLFGWDFDFLGDLNELGYFDRHSLDKVLGDFDNAGNADLDGLRLSGGDLSGGAGAQGLAAAAASLSLAGALGLVAGA